MRTEDIQYVIAVYKTRSIAKAAEIINISPQGLGKAIREFEKSLGCTLFVRSFNGVKPTPICDYMIEDLTRIYDQSERFLQKVSDFKASNYELQQILCYRSTLIDMIVDALNDYNNRFNKNIQAVAFPSVDQISEKVFHESSFEYRIEHKDRINEDLYKYYTLTTLDFYPIINSRSPLAGSDSSDINIFKDLTLLVEDSTKPYVVSFVSRCNKAGFEPKIREIYDKLLIPKVLKKDPKYISLLQKADIEKIVGPYKEDLTILNLVPPFKTELVIQCKSGQIDPQLLKILRQQLNSYSEKYLD